MSSRGGTSEETMEKQNRMMSEYLAQKVSTLKSIAFDMETDAKDHVRLLNSVDDDFDSSGGFLTGSLHRVNKMIGKGRSNRKMMCYISIFVVVVFILLYYALSRIF